jgi:hypothetical protein
MSIIVRYCKTKLRELYRTLFINAPRYQIGILCNSKNNATKLDKEEIRKVGFQVIQTITHLLLASSTYKTRTTADNKAITAVPVSSISILAEPLIWLAGYLTIQGKFTMRNPLFTEERAYFAVRVRAANLISSVFSGAGPDCVTWSPRIKSREFQFARTELQ